MATIISLVFFEIVVHIFTHNEFIQNEAVLIWSEQDYKGVIDFHDQAIGKSTKVVVNVFCSHSN